MYLVKLVSKKRKLFSIGKDHTGEISIIIHSDTLFGAICNNFRKAFGSSALEGLLNQINEENNLQISSCFHYIDIYKNKKFFKTIYLLPRPLIKLPLTDESQEFIDENPKAIKKIQFISFDTMKKLQQNEKIALSQFHIINDIYLLSDSDLEDLKLHGFLSLINSFDPKLNNIYQIIRKKISFFEVLDENKVRIKRKNKQSEPFTWSKLKFNKSSYYVMEQKNKIDVELIPGYYFLLNFENLSDEIIEQLKTSINLIKDEGLGGKRSTGNGLADGITLHEIDNSFQYYDLFERSSNFFSNISLVCPKFDELQNIKYFKLFERSGFVYSLDNKTERFNDVKFIEEGSIFSKKINGRLVQVGSDEFKSKYHDIYKNGIGFYINLGKIEGEE